MDLLKDLKQLWIGVEYPFLTLDKKPLYFSDLDNASSIDLSIVNEGDVVALIGDFDPPSIVTLLKLIDLGAIIVPLTAETKHEHAYFFDSSSVDVVINNGNINRIREKQKQDEHLSILRNDKRPGLVLFSTGTTGRPKAILHDFSIFLKRFKTPRPTLKTLNFLLFDHIGGINTLFHTLFNRGHIVATKHRTVENILYLCNEHGVELLPTTPTFLRLMLLSGLVPTKVPKTLKIITYGTERMDESTLEELCMLLPNIDFRQTFGMSELGIMRVKSESRDSLFMEIGGEGTETKIIDDILFIKNKNGMIGYLNAPSPFDEDGWYNTKDIVETKGKFIKIVGRDSDIINVGGQKFLASDVERIALDHADIDFVQVFSKPNPITGEHVEITIQLRDESKEDRISLKKYFIKTLPKHMCPQRIILSKINIGHRFKKI